MFGCTLGLTAMLAMAAHAAEWKPVEQPDLAQAAAQAKPLKPEELGTPVKTVRLEGMMMAPNPDGKTWDLLVTYFPKYGGPNTIMILDTASGEVKKFPTERGFNFHLSPKVVAPNGKLYVSILGSKSRQEICVYDPATNEMKLNAIDMPDDILGETHPMRLTTDGKLVCAGGHPTKAAAAVLIDPETGKATSYSPAGPSHAPNACWGYSVAGDERYIYIASGKVPWYLVAVDRQTGKSEALLTTEKVDGALSVSQGRFGCTARASNVLGEEKGRRIEYWLYQGKAIPKKDPKETPPWPEPKDAAPLVKLPPQPEVSLAAATPDINGDAAIWYRMPEDKPATAAKKPAVEAGIDVTAPGGEGEDREEAMDKELEGAGWKSFTFTVPLYPEGIYRLVELPDGRLFGTAGSYEGNFVFDPKTGKHEHLGKCHLSHYATTIAGGKVYMSGYPTSPLYVYDPAKPWTAGMRTGPTSRLADNSPKANPRMVVRLEKSGCHKMYAAATAANGKVYFGGRWYRNGDAGGLGWYNPADGTSGGFWDIFSNYQVNFMTAADEGKTIVISAHRIDDPLLGKPKPEQGALFFLNPETDEIVGKLEPVMKAKGPGPIAPAGPGRLIGWTENPADEKSSILYGVDVAARTVAWTKPIPFAFPFKIGSNQTEAWDFRTGPDGKVWTFLGGSLATIDPANGNVTMLGKVAGGRIAFSGRDVYLGGSATLRRILGLAK